jgi:glycerol-3-phosphate dehydrogenase
MEDAPRLLTELLRWACSEGATCLNYVDVRHLASRNDEVKGVRAFDRIRGDEILFSAPIVVNCAGPWSGDLAREFDSQAPSIFRPSLAFNLLVRRKPIAPVAVAIRPRVSESTRRSGESSPPTYFLRPWRGGLLAGTRHLPLQSSEKARPTRQEVQAFVDDLNLALPELSLEASDVVRTYSGILPAKRAGSTQLATRDVIHAHRSTGGPTGLVSVVGVKYTTARSVAERTLRVLFGKRLTPAPPACKGRPAPAARISLPEFLALEQDRPKEALEYVRRLQQEEAAQCGEDIVLRRTDWANVPKSDPSLIGRVAKSLGIPASLEKTES